MINPNAVSKTLGEIYSRFEKSGTTVIEAKMKHCPRREAEFLCVHREAFRLPAARRIFMISGPV